MSQATLWMSKHDSVDARYREALAVLWHNEKAHDEKYNPADTLEKISEVFDQGRKVAKPTHPAELVRVYAEVLFLVNNSEVNKIGLQTLLGIEAEGVHLCKEVKMAHTEVPEFNGLLQSLQVLQTEVTAVQE